jgi:hypothetical protein
MLFEEEEYLMIDNYMWSSGNWSVEDEDVIQRNNETKYKPEYLSLNILVGKILKENCSEEEKESKFEDWQKLLIIKEG